MFQSFWNVAAAFCVHEQQSQLQQSYHFGHHQNTLCVSDNHQYDHHEQSENKKTISNDLKIGEDHQDHLPSMTHLIVQNEKFDVVHPNFEVEVDPQFHWKNSYQPPDLFLQSPPPEFSPLMVG
ncbi:cation transporter [Acinetobacter sp. ANC 5054]|nr:cation transporter [Acinetobacter sp. ANC 5054]